MKKRILSLLLVLLLLWAPLACKKDDGSTDPPIGGDPDSTDTLPPDAITDEQYLDIHGYPRGFALSFSYGAEGTNGKGFSTVNSDLFDDETMLARLYEDLLAAKVYSICEQCPDLTARALSGGTAATPLDNVVYAITFTANGETYSILTDSAALQAYGQNTHVSSLNVLIQGLVVVSEELLSEAAG